MMFFHFLFLRWFFFFFFFAKKCIFHSTTRGIQLKSLNQASSTRDERFLRKKKKAVLLNGGINLTSVLVIILASRLTQQKLQKLNSTAKVLASSQRTTILHLLAEKYWSKMFTHTLESLSTVIACQFSILGIWMTQRIAATSATRESRELKGLAHALVISPESFLTTTAIQAKVWKMAESILSFTIPCGGGCHFRSLGINKLFSTHIFYICSITLNSKVLIETTGFFIFEWWTCWLQNL